MQDHLQQLLNKYSLRDDLVKRLLINKTTFEFKNNITEEEKWEYYNWVCKELKKLLIM